MKKILFVALLLTSIPVSSASKHVATKVQRLGVTYTQMIHSKLEPEERHKNQICRVNVKLYDAGLEMQVKSLTIIDDLPNPNGTLCRNVLKAIISINGFPKPDTEEVNQHIKNINLTVVP